MQHAAASPVLPGPPGRRKRRALTVLGPALLLAVLATAAFGARRFFSAFSSPPSFQASYTPVNTDATPGHHRGSDCASCHQMDPAFSHAMGIPPPPGMGLGLPLENGKIGCTTCHDVENGSPSAGPGRAMLRGSANGVGLCLKCHQGSESEASGAHALGLPWAHLPTSRNHKSKTRPGNLDLESQACIECHDGTIAGDAGTHARAAGPFMPGRDHPIGMHYRSRPGDRFSEAIDVVPAGALDRRIRLFDRTVGCGSCHNVYSRQKKLLVMSNQGSQLCLKCHAL